MAKKKETPTKKKINFNLQDERLGKMLGIALILLGVFLAIAFVSYFYTWKQDQDKVLKYSWSFLFDKENKADNWLGKLGALLSNRFFYWGFGIASVGFVGILFKFGIDLVRQQSLKSAWKWLRIILVGMVLMSVTLGIFTYQAEFPWAGAFGDSLYEWLSAFLGRIGLIILLLFSIIGVGMWRFNPNFQNVNLPETNIDTPEIKSPKIKKPKLFGWLFPGGKLDEDKDFEDHSTKVDEEGFDIVDDAKDETPEIGGEVDFDLPAKPEKKKKKLNIGKTITPDLELDVTTPRKPGESLEPAHPFEVVNDTPAPEHDQKLEIGKQETTIPEQMTVDKETAADQLEPYDPTKDLASYVPPSIDLLESYSNQKFEIDKEELEANKNQIIETLLNYKIEIVKIRATIGPTVTLYEIVPAPGVKISKIKNLEDDIALSLAALGIRIIAPIPGKGTIGIEVANKKKQIDSLKEVLQSEKYQDTKFALPIALGKTISNEVYVADLAKMPHLLIAGATGQGKSVGINTVLMSLLYKKHPSQVKIVMVDPKKVELFPYSTLDKHFLSSIPDSQEPIITDTSKVVETLNSLCIEMDERYDLLKAARARNIKEYNKKFTERKLNPNNGHKFLPYIVLVIDEFADLMMTAGKEVEMPIARLAQLARAIGIHLIIATQRPSVNIITGIIKANFPSRIAFKVTSKVDSRTILDASGADQLIGRGDMLLSEGSNVVRLQCAFVDTPEVERVIDHIAHQQGYAEPYLLPEFRSDDDLGDNAGNMKFTDLDEKLPEAARLIIANQHGSTSSIQRGLQLGYNRAGRIMDQLESLGIVGPQKGSKPREVIYFSVDEFENFWENLKSNNQPRIS